VAAVGNPDPLEFSDMRATEAPLIKASGGGLMWLSDNPDPDIRSVRANRTAGGSDWIWLRRNEGIQWRDQSAAAAARDPGGAGVPDDDRECVVA
jgi:hypothetical protein